MIKLVLEALERDPARGLGIRISISINIIMSIMMCISSIVCIVTNTNTC